MQSKLLAKTFNPYDHFGFLTGRVSRLITNRIEAEKARRGYDFPISCLSILAELWKEDGVKQQDLADTLVRHKSSITKMIVALEKDGLIIRRSVDTDKREKRIFLTTEGNNFKLHVVKKSCKGEKIATEGLTDEEIKTAKKVLKTIYERLLIHNNQED